jgi:hypothetical protein
MLDAQKVRKSVVTFAPSAIISQQTRHFGELPALPAPLPKQAR